MNLHQQFLELANASNKKLEYMLKTGKGPDPDGLPECEYNGWNTLFPFGKGPKFRKGFRWEFGKAVGYNVKMELNLDSSSPIEEPWTPDLDKNEKVQLFGWFDMRPALDESVHNLYPNALLFDYNSIGRNPVGLSGTMDYVVEVNEGDNRLLLGKFYFTPSINTKSTRMDSNSGLSTNYFLLLHEDQMR